MILCYLYYLLQIGAILHLSIVIHYKTVRNNNLECKFEFEFELKTNAFLIWCDFKLEKGEKKFANRQIRTRVDRVKTSMTCT